MAKVTAILTGDAELDKKLRALTSTKAKSIIRKATREALRPVHKDTQNRAPVGKTKQLRKGIKLRALKRSRKRIGARVTLSGVGAKGAAQEYGTYKMTGRHFMKDAAEAKRAEAQQIFKRKAQDMIKELTS